MNLFLLYKKHLADKTHDYCLFCQLFSTYLIKPKKEKK